LTADPCLSSLDCLLTNRVVFPKESFGSSASSIRRRADSNDATISRRFLQVVGWRIVVPSQIRVAAGVCVLAVGLMMGAAGVAVADPDAGDAVAASGDENSTVSQQETTTTTTTPTAPDDSAAAAERNAVEGVASTVGSGRRPGDPVPTSVDGATEGPAVVARAGDDDSDVVAADSGPGTSNSEPASSAPAPTAEPSEVVAPPTVDPEPQAPEVVSVTAAVAPATTAGPPAAVAPATTAVPPAAVAPANTAAPPAAVAPTSTAVPPAAVPPVTNATPSVVYLTSEDCATLPLAAVIATVRYLLRAAVVVPLVHLRQLRHDLALLFAVTGADPVLGGHAPVPVGVGLSTAVQVPLGLESSPVRPITIPVNLMSSATSVDAITRTPLGAITAMKGARASDAPPPGSAPKPPTPDEPVSASVQSFISDVGRELLRSPTLMALAVAALPGVGGLVILTAAGVRLGYRQAKAGLAMRTAGIARFAHTGPLGVVRSESLVYVRPRKSRVGSVSAISVLDEAA
jgi:hypothetical protein